MIIQPADVNAGRQHVLLLLSHGMAAKAAMDRYDESAYSCYDAERRAKVVLAWLLAANAVLNSLPELHSEMIEHPHFMELRALQRRFMQ